MVDDDGWKASVCGWMNGGWIASPVVKVGEVGLVGGGRIRSSGGGELESNRTKAAARQVGRAVGGKKIKEG